MGASWGNARSVGCLLAAWALSSAIAAWAHGQYSANRPAAPPRASRSASRSAPAYPRNQNNRDQARSGKSGDRQQRNEPMQNGQSRYGAMRNNQTYAAQNPGKYSAGPSSAPRATVAPQPAYPGPPYLGPHYARPAVPGYAPPSQLPQGHLGYWLDQHRNLPLQDQERELRGDPSFKRLHPSEQQRLVQQLHQVNQLTPEQQQRRLGRVQMLEQLSPQERMQVNLSQRRWAALPQDRQAVLKNAFHDLRAVPLEERQTVLNSSRYRGVFSIEERGILSDLLRVEPFQPAR